MKNCTGDLFFAHRATSFERKTLPVMFSNDVAETTKTNQLSLPNDPRYGPSTYPQVPRYGPPTYPPDPRYGPPTYPPNPLYGPQTNTPIQSVSGGKTKKKKRIKKKTREQEMFILYSNRR